LKKVKRGDLEIDFYEGLLELKEKSEALPKPEKSLPSKSSNKIPLRVSESSSHYDIHSLVQLSPTAAINFSWAYVDQEIRSAIVRLGITSEYPKEGSIIRFIRLLKQHKAIDEPVYEVLMRLRDLRDKSAHLVNDPNILAEDAEEYDELARKMITRLAVLQPRKSA
jgi:hypothetical protein